MLRKEEISDAMEIDTQSHENDKESRKRKQVDEEKTELPQTKQLKFDLNAVADDVKRKKDELGELESNFKKLLTDAASRLEQKPSDADKTLSDFTQLWKNNLKRTIASLKDFSFPIPHKELISRLKENFYFFEERLFLEDLPADKEGYLGIDAVLAEDLPKAKHHFEMAVKSGDKTCYRLWLVIVLFKLKQYDEAIELCNLMLKDEAWESSVAIVFQSNIYYLYPVLPQDIIDKFNLNFTHQHRLTSELYYYRALCYREKRNDLDYKRDLTTMHFQRGENCFYKYQFNYAIASYKQALALFPNESQISFRLGMAYFALGQTEGAGACFKSCLEHSTNKKDKSVYLSRIIELDREIGRIDRMRYLANQTLDNEPTSNSQFKAFSHLIRTVLLSPQTSCWEELVSYFDKLCQLYFKLNDPGSQQYFYSILNDALKDLFAFNDILSQKNSFETNVLVYKRFLKLYDDLMKNILDGDFNFSSKIFPNWCYDRLFVDYLNLLLERYVDYRSDRRALKDSAEKNEFKEIDNEFKKRIKLINDDIKPVLNNLVRKSAKADTELLNLLWNIVCPTDEKQEVGESKDVVMVDKNEVMSEIELLLTELEKLATKNGKDVEQVYQYSLKAAPTCQKDDKGFVRRKDWEDIILYRYKHEHTFCEIYFTHKLKRLEIIASLFSLKKCLEKNKYFILFQEENRKLIEDIDKYKNFVKAEKNKTAGRYKHSQITIFEHKLCLLVAEILLNCVSGKLLSDMVSDKGSLLKDCEKSVKRLDNLEQNDIHPIYRLEYLNSHVEAQELPDALQKRLLGTYRTNLNEVKARFKLQQKSLAADPLAILFGEEDYASEKSPFIINFPHSQLTAQIDQVKKKYQIIAPANLSIHGITFVFTHVENKNEYEIAFMPITAHNDAKDQQIELLAFDSVAPRAAEQQTKKSIVDRIQAGFAVVSKPTQAAGPSVFFKPKNKPVDQFQDKLHKHSEQHFFEYLRLADIGKLLEKLGGLHSKFNKQSTILAVLFDMYSDKISCDNCKLAEIAEQQHQGSTYEGFVARLEKHVKTDRGQLQPIKSVTRVLAGKKFTAENYSDYKNPADKNISHMDENMAIFESTMPTPVVSGSSYRYG